MKRKIPFFLLVVLFIIFYAGKMYAKNPGHIGDRLTNFKLKTIQAKNIRIRDVIKDKIAVINFTTTWCTDCKKLEKVLSTIIPAYRKKGVEFCFIYVGQSQKMVCQKNGKGDEDSAPIRLLDEKRKAFFKWKLTSVPHLVMVDKKGIVRYEGLLLQEKQIVTELEKVIERSKNSNGTNGP